MNATLARHHPRDDAADPLPPTPPRAADERVGWVSASATHHPRLVGGADPPYMSRPSQAEFRLKSCLFAAAALVALLGATVAAADDPATKGNDPPAEAAALEF